MKLLVASFLVLIHSWYPNVCCHDRDCVPVDCNLIHSKGTDWEYSGRLIAKNKTQVSPDGACHICSNEYAGIMCIFMGGGA